MKFKTPNYPNWIKANKKRMKINHYKIALHKRYFDIGYGITNVIKYAVGIIGIASLIKGNATTLAVLGFAYLIFCYFFGLFWLKSGMFKAEIEVSNQHNKFVEEMRNTYNNGGAI